MKSLSIICQKGGVGKTTIVVNIGKIFAINGIKTLIIDLDPQGNTSTYLDFDKNNEFILTSQDLMSGNKSKEIGYLHENMAIIPSNQSILKFNNEKILGGSVLKKTIDSIEFKDFDVILFDTPPTMSSLVQEALSASDFYLIPTKPEFLAIEGVSQAMNFAKKSISNQININPVFLGVILNQVDTRRSSFQSFENELKFLLADKLFNSKISQLTEIADSPFYAKTVLDFNENSKAKLEFIELSNEIFEKVGL